MIVTPEEIERGKTRRGGWTRKTLAKWGVPWPPPKGWKRLLNEGYDFTQIRKYPSERELFSRLEDWG